MAYIGKSPASVALTSSDITDGIISTAKIADAGITNAKLNADIISGDTALGAEPADTDELLVSDAGVLKRMDYSYIKSGGNTPAFQAHLSSAQTGISDNTMTKVSINSEDYDSDGTFDNSSNYRWTPAEAGKYFVYGQVYIDGETHHVATMLVSIYLNGAAKIDHYFDIDANLFQRQMVSAFGIIDMDDNDYIELFAKADVSSGSVQFDASSRLETHFGGFKVE